LNSPARAAMLGPRFWCRERS